jgi:DNA-binding XRE family transcriptional regulator
MAYSDQTKHIVYNSPKTLGNRLGRWAVHLDLPVAKLAKSLGVTRQTVYNWFEGGEVFIAYRARVTALIKIMETSSTAEDAWRKICQAYDLKT